MSGHHTIPHSIPLPSRGWTPQAMARFLDHLSARGNVRAACARVGLSAEAAYRLRRRDALFARGWAAALVLARDSSEQVLATRALDGVEQPVFHRGEEVGTRIQYDTRLLLAHLARLDRLVEEDGQAPEDAGRFDEILALIAGERFPEELAGGDEALPMGRAEAGDEAAADAQDRLLYEQGEPEQGEDWPGDEDAHDARAGAIVAAGEAARAETEAQWDGWFARACATVDGLVDATPHRPSSVEPASAEPPLAQSTPTQTPPARSTPAQSSPDEDHRVFDPGVISKQVAAPAGSEITENRHPGTVSTVSTSALACGLSGPARDFAAESHPAFHARKQAG